MVDKVLQPLIVAQVAYVTVSPQPFDLVVEFIEEIKEEDAILDKGPTTKTLHNQEITCWTHRSTVPIKILNLGTKACIIDNFVWSSNDDIALSQTMLK